MTMVWLKVGEYALKYPSALLEIFDVGLAGAAAPGLVVLWVREFQ